MPSGAVLPVRGDVRRVYDRLGRIYGLIEEYLEGGLRRRGLQRLGLAPGERVLELGCGTGCTLVMMVGMTGAGGCICGIDATPRMVQLARHRLEKAGRGSMVGLFLADARALPFRDGAFDTVYASAVLELFDTPDIPVVLGEVRRVLRAGGPLGLASMPREGHERSPGLRLYEWAHRAFPRWASCRPIYVEESVRQAGFEVHGAEEVRLGGIFPMKVVVARRP